MRKLKWYQVVAFFVVFFGSIGLRAWMKASDRDEMRANEQALDELRQRACACRDQGDAVCGAQVRDELLTHWEGRTLRADDESAHLLTSIVRVTEGCLEQVGTPSGLRFE